MNHFDHQHIPGSSGSLKPIMNVNNCRNKQITTTQSNENKLNFELFYGISNIANFNMYLFGKEIFTK
jgi:hypothetical protein